jgi:hypothetical protein
MVYVIDVPEVRTFTTQFVYNFFVADERTSYVSGVPREALERRADGIDDEFVRYARTRVPRYVALAWKNPTVRDPSHETTDNEIRSGVHKPTYPGLISDNLSKIVSEDAFSSNNFTSVTFKDGDIETKIFNYVSGTYDQLTLDQPKDPDSSHSKAASRLQALTPRNVKPHFLYPAMTSTDLAFGAKFNDSSQTIDEYVKKLNNFLIHAQINTKFLKNVTDKLARDPNSPYKAEVHELRSRASVLSKSATDKMSPVVDEEEFKTVAPYVDIKVNKSVPLNDAGTAKIVGYVIDRYELNDDGSSTSLEPIIIENPSVGFTVDPRIKYGKTYDYAVRTISLFSMPGIDIDSGDVATISVLVSSRPSSVSRIQAFENVAPPPPSDINFTWDYENDRLMIHWAFPPNSQRDIKKFQVFRRSSVDDAFELLKVYDFDDSTIRTTTGEMQPDHLVEYLTNPVTWYIDDDFKVPRTVGPVGFSSSRYIYTVCCIDAHGLTSNYGAQFEIWFDQFKNQLMKRLVSHSGAPKPYPNMYLEADAFVDTIKVNGPTSRRLKLYFNPEYYAIENSDGNLQKVVSTVQDGGCYKFQFINVDSQKSQIVTVNVDDRTKAIKSKLAYPSGRYGAPSRSSSGR